MTSSKPSSIRPCITSSTISLKTRWHLVAPSSGKSTVTMLASTQSGSICTVPPDPGRKANSPKISLTLIWARTARSLSERSSPPRPPKTRTPSPPLACNRIRSSSRRCPGSPQGPLDDRFRRQPGRTLLVPQTPLRPRRLPHQPTLRRPER